MRIVLLIAVFFTLSGSVFAAPIKGAGAVTCGTWLESRQNGTWIAEISWVQGFISAYNHFLHLGDEEDGIFGNADSPAIAAWLDNYCKENPLNSVYEGTVELVDELKTRVVD